MAAFEYQKVKSVAKSVKVKGPELEALILKTMKTIADIVGATLGPGGCPVLIERQEHGLPPIITKDGVTVYRALGLDDATAHTIMESARDASQRTAAEAGDGTTTTAVLSEAIVRLTAEYRKRNPRVSSQRIVRKLMSVFNQEIEPLIQKLSMSADLSTPEGRKMLWAAAKISANGDTDLADAVLQCYDVVGDDGNVTLLEVSGAHGYEVERIEGYPIPVGFEDSCGKYVNKFINDPGNLRTVLENPAFLVYYGAITEIQTLVNLMERVGDDWQKNGGRHNVVLVATGFSESVLGQLALNFAEMTTVNVYPLKAPMSPFANGQFGFLEDMCAVTGATMLDPLNMPLQTADLEHLGRFAKTFEAGRWKSTVLAEVDAEGNFLDEAAITIEAQASKLEQQMLQAASELDKNHLQERLGKLTGGIAKLKISGSSNGGLRERRDRAEDAVCAVRGAIKHGVLPGGCWTLMRVAKELGKSKDPVIKEILIPALGTPLEKLLENLGFTETEIESTKKKVVEGMKNDAVVVYDALEDVFVDPVEGAVLDSTPAVLEAIRNSLSVATVMGTTGGTIVFKRDLELERKESNDTRSFLRDAEEGKNPADERGM